MKSILWIVAAVLCNTGAQLALKHGAMTEIGNWQAWLRPSLLLGAALYVVSFVLTVRVYADYPLGIISPLMAGAIFICVNIFAYLIFAEPVTVRKGVGIACVVAGIFLLAQEA